MNPPGLHQREISLLSREGRVLTRVVVPEWEDPEQMPEILVWGSHSFVRQAGEYYLEGRVLQVYTRSEWESMQ